MSAPALPDPFDYRGQTVCLASMHGKERAIGRPFRLGLGLGLVRPADLDTDTFGTFTGERGRPGDAAATCRLKAEAGMAQSGLELGLASEGSFGPHPALPMLTAGYEWMTFVDRRQDLVITEHQLFWRTNFSHRRIAPGEDPGAWLQRVGFPGHAVIVRPSVASCSGDDGGGVVKGIRSPMLLKVALERAAARSEDRCVLLETDMRAHMNPTRMAAIRSLAFRLVRRIRSRCPACATPGWGLIDTIDGLPCGWCGQATPLTRQERHGCPRCGHQESLPRRDGRLVADPGDCPYCNP